tara:strand:- start:33 stop:809 length:777 start_codon:yes stop_codon:yes gene_type:complete
VKEIINYKKFVEKIGIKKNDKILINSNFLRIMILAKKKKKIFNLTKLVNAILNRLGSGGTLVIPAYSWDFIKKKTFIVEKTKSITGSLSNHIINNEKFKRTHNPIYSFLVAGKDQKYLCSLKHQDSFSLNSPFGYLIKNKGKNIFLDIDYKDSFTFVHLAEQKIGVNYRFKKKFSGYIYRNSKKKKNTTFMYARRLNTGVKGTKIDKKFDLILKKTRSLISKKVFTLNCQVIDVHKAYGIMVNNLLSKNKLIYPIFKK